MEFALKFLVNIQKLPDKGLKIKLEANEKELALLKNNHDLVDIEYFIAEYSLIKWKANSLKLSGYIKAKIKQYCVATLAEIPADINENINIIYVQKNSKLLKGYEYKNDSELFLSLDNKWDNIEIYEGNSIDIGAISEEMFELSLDPYPRVKDEALQIFTIEDNTRDKEKNCKGDKKNIEESKSPFAILKKFE